ncbi:MAG: DUF2520 domain-containing protein [Mediterranea sp.]|jgi:predicted short-subunit dehydrogenase-like oxidoreductase (DUF2520 family)|nr:DUF2520 domain-containing protein [Mediterranea sp.]
MISSAEQTSPHSIYFIGAGNVATHLAKAFHRAGFRIAGIYSRTEASAHALACQVETDYTTALDEVKTDADIYVVSLADDALIHLIPQIAAGKGNALLVHTAGSIPMNVWQEHAVHYGVLYPLQTFSKQTEPDIRQTPFFVEGCSPDAVRLLKELASALSDAVYEADSTQRRMLHLAAVFACNFTNHLYALAEELLRQNCLPFDALLPLIDQTTQKIHRLSPAEAQTGPAARGDKQVMQTHEALLAGNPRMQALYRLISESITEHNTQNLCIK